jgi:para-aminobenzoate synthetase component 2
MITWLIGLSLFGDAPNPINTEALKNLKYSLAVEPATIGDQLEVTGRTESGVVMSMRHKTLPIEGVQFHPESVLTEHGHKLLANWLTQCGDKNAQSKAVGLSPVIGR